MSACVCEGERVYACAREREIVSENTSVRERERENVCVLERERECVCSSACLNLIECISVGVSKKKETEGAWKETIEEGWERKKKNECI